MPKSETITSDKPRQKLLKFGWSADEIQIVSENIVAVKLTCRNSSTTLIRCCEMFQQSARQCFIGDASFDQSHAAFDLAIASFSGQRFTLRNGILLIREDPRVVGDGVIGTPGS